MNETNIKHGYSLMVRDVRGAIWNPKFEKQGQNLGPTRGTILESGAQYWGRQGLDFLIMLAPGAGPAK